MALIKLLCTGASVVLSSSTGWNPWQTVSHFGASECCCDTTLQGKVRTGIYKYRQRHNTGESLNSSMRSRKTICSQLSSLLVSRQSPRISLEQSGPMASNLCFTLAIRRSEGLALAPSWIWHCKYCYVHWGEDKTTHRNAKHQLGGRGLQLHNRNPKSVVVSGRRLLRGMVAPRLFCGTSNVKGQWKI